MAVLTTGASSSTFKLDGNEYSKGLYEAFYKNITTLPDGESNEKTLEVGLININTGVVIQEPIQIRAWKDSVGTAYTTLDSLIADLTDVAGLASGVPISSYSIKKVFPSIGILYTQVGEPQFLYTEPTVMDYSGYGVDHPRIIQLPGGQGWNISGFLNFDKATQLEDVGTGIALKFSGLTIDAAVLDDLFTQLPVTTKTVTIDLVATSGAATCDATIATAKGYTVVTA